MCTYPAHRASKAATVFLLAGLLAYPIACSHVCMWVCMWVWVWVWVWVWEREREGKKDTHSHMHTQRTHTLKHSHTHTLTLTHLHTLPLSLCNTWQEDTALSLSKQRAELWEAQEDTMKSLAHVQKQLAAATAATETQEKNE